MLKIDWLLNRKLTVDVNTKEPNPSVPSEYYFKYTEIKSVRISYIKIQFGNCHVQRKFIFITILYNNNSYNLSLYLYNIFLKQIPNY